MANQHFQTIYKAKIQSFLRRHFFQLLRYEGKQNSHPHRKFSNFTTQFGILNLHVQLFTMLAPTAAAYLSLYDYAELSCRFW